MRPVSDTLFDVAPRVAEIERTATISDCGRYRYTLGRTWSDEPPVLFVMLNPSTADADVDDNTISKCIGFAKRWGHGGITVVNLYAWRATNPKELPDDFSVGEGGVPSASAVRVIRRPRASARRGSG
jgi:hypothetical protein